ncbi:TPA: hypothetical protein U5D40_002603 [Yersinia enterocolitica]|nr:hypothetical protein [Yersinia enterocolitica]
MTKFKIWLKTWWWDNHEKSNSIFSSIHYLVITLAIIVGAIWSAWTFNALFMAQNAETALRKAQEELKIVKEQLKNTDSSSITISTEKLKEQLGVIINISIKNNGKNPLSFDLKKGAVKIYNVSPVGDKIKSNHELTPEYYASLSSDSNDVLDKVTVLIGAEKTLSYIVTMNEPGIYYITFTSKPNEEFDAPVIKNEKPLKWFASKFIEI